MVRVLILVAGFDSTVYSDDKGRKILNAWMDTFGIKYVCKLVSVEMETANPNSISLHHMNLDEVTPEYMSKWDINDIMDPISTKITPVWSKVLYAATEPLKKDDKPNLRNRGIVSASNLYSCYLSITFLRHGILSVHLPTTFALKPLVKFKWACRFLPGLLVLLTR